MEPKPWYKQFYPWMLIGIPFLTVVGCVITIALAINSPNALVKDDYYKEGLAINADKHRQKQAGVLGLEGLLRGSDQRVSVSLQGKLAHWPDVLLLELAHATREEMDRSIMLNRTGAGQYEADWTQLPDGHWYYSLQPQSREWELQGRIRAEDVFQVRLGAQQ